MREASTLLPLGLAASLCVVAAGCGDDGECPVGSERCACTTGGACDPGLTCLSGLCVNAGVDGGQDSSVQDGASHGPDAATDATAVTDASRDAMASDASDASADAGNDASSGCDPVSQSRCPEGRRCAIHVETGEPSCVEPGSISPGESCSPAPDGFDDCASVDGAGSLCVSGTCRMLCDGPGDDACPEGDACAELALPGSSVGFCRPTCSPVLQDCVEPEQACYWSYGGAHGFCSHVAHPGSTQDEACARPEGGVRCYDNGCAAGYGPQHTALDVTIPVDFCAYYCRPADTHTAQMEQAAGVSPQSCALADGGPGPGYQCRFMQSTYYGGPEIPAAVGYCVSTSAGFGDCTTCDVSTPEAFLDTCAGGASSAVACVSNATVDAILAMGETVCDDGRDADADGLTDCDDSDCDGDPACA